MPKKGTAFPGADQAASMMKALITAQQRWMQQALTSMPAGDAMPPVFAAMGKQWQQAAREQAAAWAETTPSVVRATVRQMLNSQSVLVQLFHVAADAGQRIGRQAAEGDDPADAVEETVEQMEAQMRRLIDTWSTATHDVQAQWQRFFEALQHAGMPFGVMMNLPGMMQPQPDADEEGETPLRTLFDQTFKRYTYEHIVERLLDTPGLGLSREFNEKLQQGFKAFQAYQRAATRYQSTVARIWARALRRFVYALGERARAGEPTDDLRDLSTLWTNVADDVFIAAFRTEDYLEAQRELSSAAMDFRTRRRAILEAYQRALDQPTRTELDEVHALLYRLRKENKEIARELKALRAEVDALRDGSTDDIPDELTAIKGIGPATADRLREAGIATFAELATASPAAVRGALDRPVGDDRIAAWQEAALERARAA